MPLNCCVVGCSVRGNRDRVRFFRIPMAMKLYHRCDLNELSKYRRESWIKAINRGNLTETYWKNSRVCSRHFIKGEPADLKDIDNPDWVPSLNLGYDALAKLDKKSVERCKKAIEQAKKDTVSMLPLDYPIWTKDFTIDFLKMYKKLPCLWKIGSEVHANKLLRNSAYEILVEMCKNNVSKEANRDYVNRKIQSLRRAFCREHEKVIESKRRGNRPEDVYVPTLWYYDLLLFTVDEEKPNQHFGDMKRWDSEETLEAVENVEEAEYATEEDLPQVSTTVTQFQEEIRQKTESEYEPKRRKIDENTEFSEKRREMMENIEEYEAAAISWAKKLKRMNPTQAVYAEFLVNKILSMALLDQLDKTTDIITEQSSSTCDNVLYFGESSEEKPTVYSYVSIDNNYLK